MSAPSTRRDPLFGVLCAALLAVALVLPFVNPPYLVQSYTRILVVTIAVVSLNLLTGYAGVFSLGHGAFFGIGAYTTAILTADHGWPWWATALPSLVVAFAAGMLVGVPTLRIRGLHLAVVTLALGALFPYLVTRFSGLTGGNQGKVVPTVRPPEWLPLERDQFGYLICLAAVVVVTVGVHGIGRSRSGRALLAMRDDETAAVLLGVDVARLKIAVFGLSAALAGLAGTLFVATQGIISSETHYLTLTGSIAYLAAMVIGGATTVLGPVVGSLIAVELPELLSGLDPVLAHVIYGVLLIVVILTMREGIVGTIGRSRARRRTTTPPPAAEPARPARARTPSRSLPPR